MPSKETLTTKPHPEEVDDIKWVTQPQLLSMMEDPKLLFSPWFRIIAKRWIIGKNGWWENLDEAMNTDKYCDYKTISRFDPPKEHMGGLGDAGPWLGNFDDEEVKKGDAS